jgi:hypothetical protein
MGQLCLQDLHVSQTAHDSSSGSRSSKQPIRQASDVRIRNLQRAGMCRLSRSYDWNRWLLESDPEFVATRCSAKKVRDTRSQHLCQNCSIIFSKDFHQRGTDRSQPSHRLFYCESDFM